MQKSLGFWELVAIGVGGMVGGGIFAVLGLAVELAGPATPIAFLAAGILALLTAYSYAKLSQRYPSRGGTVEFVAVAFKNGALAGAINTLLLFSYIVMLALYAYAFGSYASALFGVPFRWIFTSAVLLLFMLVNLRGARSVGRAEDLVVFLKVAILTVFVLAGLRSVRLANFSAPIPDAFSILAGGMIIFLAYEGFELISNAAEDADKKAIAHALIVSVLFVTVLYVSTAFVAVGSLPVSEIVRARDYALAEAARPALGDLGFVLISVAALLSTASAINATIYGAARVAYAIAVEGELPRILARTAGNVPLEGLLLVTLSALLVANTVDLSGISAMGSAGFLIVFTAVNAAAWKLSKEVHAFKVLPALSTFLTFMAFLVLVSREAQTRPHNTVFLIVLILSAFFVEAAYRIAVRRRIRLRFWSEH